ncbi:MAG: hypothetical protein KH436_07065 [Firmicutes bacterium]|nr:hypothetical protein [Bacillota bacterium]
MPFWRIRAKKTGIPVFTADSRFLSAAAALQAFRAEGKNAFPVFIIITLKDKNVNSVFENIFRIFDKNFHAFRRDSESTPADAHKGKELPTAAPLLPP